VLPHSDLATHLATPSAIQERATDVSIDSSEQAEVNEAVSRNENPWWDGSGMDIVHATRSWIQYGTFAFAVICIVIGAVEALFGR
jgi:hypothetical protein